MIKARKFASAVAGFAAALAVAGLAVFAPVAASANDLYDLGGVEVNLPAGDGALIVDNVGGEPSTYLTAGDAYIVPVRYTPNTQVTLTVTLPAGTPDGAYIEVLGTISATGTTNADGLIFFRVHIPAGTPAGNATFVASNTATGAAVPNGAQTLQIGAPGNGGGNGGGADAPAAVRHPAAG